MKDEAEAGLLYESQSKLTRSKRLLRWYTCTVQYSTQLGERPPA